MNSEKKLINQARHDQQTFLELYNFYYPKLFAYLMLRAKDRELVEDVLQETFISSITALKKYEYKGKSFGAWLFKIAKNKMVDNWRKQNKVVTYEDSTELETKMEFSDSPETELIAQEDLENENLQKQQLVLAMKKLPENDQEILKLKYICDLSYKEISEILNVKTTTLAVRLYRALERLKKLI